MIENDCSLRHDHFRATLRLAMDTGYEALTCAEYATTGSTADRLIVLRHDIDLLPERAPAMARIEADLGIRATYFVRVHANEYNAFSHETLAVLRDLIAMGHEIGVHVEPLDLLASCGVEPRAAITASVTALNTMLATEIKGIASHNDITPDNNLDFFRTTPATELGVRYEAYDSAGLDLFDNSWYVTDGHFWKWRAFDRGKLTDNQDCLCRHIAAGATPLYCLTHPHVWYRDHFQRVHY